MFPLLSTGEATSGYSCPHLAPSSRGTWTSWQGAAKAAQGLEHLTHQDGLVGSGRREAEEGLRAAHGYRKCKCKGDRWDHTVLGEQHDKGHQPSVAPWELEVGEETSFPTDTAAVLYMAHGKVPRQRTGRQSDDKMRIDQISA